MVEIIKTDKFDRWLLKLRDGQARARIEVRIRPLSLGHLGDVKPVGENVSEMRINYGPGYRIYFTGNSSVMAVLLCGGDKDSQDEEIKTAKHIAREWRNQL